MPHKMNNIEKYNRLKRPSLKGRIQSVQTFLPKPKKSDYDLGYINRYFVQLVNDKSSPIYEVNRGVYNSYKGKAFYTTTSLKWRISGESFDMEGNLINKSVKESNRVSLRLASKRIPNLKLYLPNLLQFYKK